MPYIPASRIRICLVTFMLLYGLVPRIHAQLDITLIDSFKTKLQETTEDTARAEVYLRLAQAVTYANPREAIGYIYQAQEIIEGIQYPLLYHFSQSDLANIYLVMNELDSSLVILNSLIDLGKDSLPVRLYCKALLSKALIFKRHNQIDSSLAIYKGLIPIYEETKDSTNLAITHINMASDYAARSEFETSLEHALSALKLLPEPMGHFQAVTKNMLAWVYRSLGEEDKAIENYEEILAHFTKIGDVRRIAYTISYLAPVYIDLGIYDKADSLLKVSEKLLETYFDINLRINNYVQQAGIAVHQNSPQLAANLLNKAKPLLAETKTIATKHFYLVTLTDVQTELGQFEQAERSGKQALVLSKEIADPEYTKITYAALQKMAIKKKDYKQAFEYLQKHTSLSDSLQDATNERAFAEKEAKYQNEKKSQELAISASKLEQEQAENDRKTTLLRTLGVGLAILLLLIGLIGYFWRNTRRLNQQLKQANEKKASLLKEIHHRVKNNLQIISSLLDLQVRREEDNAVKASISEGRNRVKSMALIHQKLYQTEDVSEVDFQDYLDQLVLALDEGFKQENQKIHTLIEANDIKLDIDTAIPLGLIINELVTNAYKYAFSGRASGNIHIRIEKLAEEDRYLLQVTDDGIGLPDGFSIKKARSLGLKLVKALTQQLKGKVEVISDTGTQFKVVFKERTVLKTAI